MERESVNQKMVNSMISNGRPKYFNYVCERCGVPFTSTNDTNPGLCLCCIVKKDMKMDDDTIINVNIINIWKAKRFDSEKGINPMLKSIAEGVVLLDNKIKRNDNTYLKIVDGKKNNDRIEEYVKDIIDNNTSHDAVVILRFNPKEDFSIFLIRFGNRIIKKIGEYYEDKFFMKNLCLDIVIKNKFRSQQ